EQCVALFLDRSSAIVVAVLGVLKAGAAYVPIDPAYPRDRAGFVLEDCGAHLLLATHDVEDRLPRHPQTTLYVDDVINRDSGSRPARVDVRGDNAAYVIYTSGSTGRPKGVVVSHEQVLRLFDSTREWFAFEQTDVWTLFHSYAFDFSVWEMWGALLHGG